MARRPAFVESAEKPRVLVCASVEVPGPSSAGVRAEQVLLAFSGDLDVDALSLKGKNLTHIQRVGAARMLRVPVPAPQPGDGTAAHAVFLERLATFKRALLRQLDNDGYDVVICLDLFAAAAVLPSLGRARLVIEVSELPSVGYDARFPVSGLDKDTRIEWELGERAALKAAALVVAPSRQAARALSDRMDPRAIRAFPRLVDTRIFQPPTVEVDLGDTHTVAFVGGREGGARGAVMVSALKLLGARSHDVRFVLVGTPSPADGALVDGLQRSGILERCAFVDVSSQADIQAALCAADVVVVPGDDDAWAVPHRALEAMACGRATVIAASEAACRDQVTAEQAKVVPADAPERIADAVADLLSDPVARARMAKAGLRQAQRFDLGARGQELGTLLTEATGVRFGCTLPPLEEVTSPAPIARAVPATPSSMRTALVAPVAVVSSAPSLVQALVAVDVAGGPAPAALPPLADDHLDAPTIDTGELPAAVNIPSPRPPLPASVPMALLADSGRAGDVWAGDVWAGDTMFDPGSLVSPSSPVPNQVKEAMLNTDSGSAAMPRPTVAPDTETGSATAKRPAHTSGPSARSLRIIEGDTSRSDDEWGLDTIADASPLVEPTRVPTQERAVITHPPKSFLVEHGVGDMTAEDDAEG